MKPEEIAKLIAKPQQVADSPTAKLIRKVSQSPTANLARQAPESPTAKLARKVAESPTGQAATFADELQRIRRQLATPEGSARAIAESKARNAAARAAAPELTSPVVVPPPVPQKIDTDGLIRRAKEIFAEDAEAKRELDRKMVETMEKMHGALVEANQRETEALDRAEAAEAREVAAQVRAEKRDSLMVKATVAATVIAALSLAAAVIAIFVAASAGG